MAFIDNLDDLHESQWLELKEASFEVPDDVWESYSAFANTEGGEIVLGVTEGADGSFSITGVVEPDKLISQFWTIVRNPEKVERDVLLEDGVRKLSIDGVDVVIINVPRAERGEKPVRIKRRRDKQFTTWIRRWSSDVQATREDMRQMEYDNAERADRQVLEGFALSALNESTIARYRTVFSGNKPSSPWNADSTEDFLYHIGALARGRDGQIHPTQAGLLAFGNEFEITNYLPQFLLDYRRQSSTGTRWDDRIVSQDGDWSGNLLDFYFDVTERLLHAFRTPFSTDVTGTRHRKVNPVTEAVNEAVANAIIHAYYGGSSSIVVVLDDTAMQVKNPGSFLVDREVAIAGGMSEQRNPTLMRIFAFIGVSDRAGSGVQTIFETWQGQFGEVPQITEDHAPSYVSLTLPLSLGLLANQHVEKNVVKRQRTTLSDEELYTFLSQSAKGVNSTEVSSHFGVSIRVAQKHLAKLYASAEGSIVRDDNSTPYVYHVA